MSIQDQERRRIAGELHDSAGQNLAALSRSIVDSTHVRSAYAQRHHALFSCRKHIILTRIICRGRSKLGEKCYVNESANLPIVRSRSMSVRRRASIFLIALKTVV